MYNNNNNKMFKIIKLNRDTDDYLTHLEVEIDGKIINCIYNTDHYEFNELINIRKWKENYIAEFDFSDGHEIIMLNNPEKQNNHEIICTEMGYKIVNNNTYLIIFAKKMDK